MAVMNTTLECLSNPLVTIEQLTNSASQLDGVPHSLENSLRYHGGLLTQAAGILLKLPQEMIAQAIVLLARFYVGPEGGSFRLHSLKDISAATVYLTAKVSFLPQSLRSILNVYAYLTSSQSMLLSPSNPHKNGSTSEQPDLASFTLSQGAYLSSRQTLLQCESLILRALCYTTRVTLPHPLALTYLQTLALLPSPPTETSRALALRTLELLNSALLSPQLLYLTHQPNALAVAAIYLAAREIRVKVGGAEWWRVWDVEREELGFLVVAMLSLRDFAENERADWGDRRIPCTTDELVKEIETREVANT